MAEFDGPDRLKTNDQDGEIVRLLASPETQAGLETVKSKVEEHWAELEESGRKIDKKFEGVTPDGTRVEVARYPDPSNPREGVGFAVFVYDLHQVASPGFANELAPSRLGQFVEFSGGGIDIGVERPNDPMPEGSEDYLNWLRDKGQLRDADPDEMTRIRSVAKAYDKWSRRNTLHLPQVPSDTMRYRGQVMSSFKDAAFGERRMTIAAAEVASLREHAYENLREAVEAGIRGDTAAEQAHETARAELLARARTTIDTMHANPDKVDDPGVVHDRVKAEHMAHEAKASMDKAVVAKAGRARHEANAERRAEQAAAEYDADPLGAPNKPPMKQGLFGWLRRR